MKKTWALFAWGFRPFFLLAGLFAIAAIAGWMFLYASGAERLGVLPTPLWHAHEMLYGFVGAAIAGFLLTAAPNWAGGQSINGWPLAALALVWLLGRIGLLLTGVLPPYVVIALAAVWIPGVILAIFGPMLLSGRIPMLLVIIAYWLTDVVFLLSIFAGEVSTARLALQAGIGIVLVLITIIGGRIVPAFTANSLRTRGLEVKITASPMLDRIVIAAMLAYVIAGIAQISNAGMAAIAGIAGILQLARLVRWHGFSGWPPSPIVWILHVAYAAMPAGLILRAIFASTGAAWAAQWQHVLTMGVAATMVLAVMTRAALGHTGRPLVVASATTLAYVALVLATISRAFAPVLLPVSYFATVMLAGGLWLFAFSLFTFVYAPILAKPRADGKAG